MLSRPALSIRRLISQKNKGVEVDEDPFYLHDEIDTIKASYKDIKGSGRTWMTPMMRRPNSKSSFDIPRSEDIHRISLIPPFPDTPHSSRSSLCSCENGTTHSSPRSSPGLPHTRSPRSSPLLRPRHHVEQTQHGHGRGPSRSPPRIPMEPPHSPPPTPQPSQHRSSPEPESDMSDAPLALEDDEERKQSEEESGSYSDNIQQLIRETDEAFKFDAFVEAKLPSPGLPETQEPMSIPPTPTRPTRARSQRLSQPSLKSPTTKPYVKASLQPNAGGARPGVGSKTKRTRSKKARRKSRAPTTQSSRWGLAESAKDLFTIRIFSRIEADEMLPESTLHEIRMSRASHNSQWAKYKESMVSGVETDEFGTPRIIDSPNVSPGLRSAAEEVDIDTPRSSVSKSEEIDRDSCATPKPEPQVQEQPQAQQPHFDAAPAPDVEIEVEDDEDTLPIMMMMDESKPKTVAAIPVPPPKRSSPRRLPSRQLPPLPTIPEVIATGPENALVSPPSILPAAPGSASKINKDDYVFFPSTRYTITMPTFCHGPIRLAKADLPIGKLAAAVDDTLDWTAFQMAILGGAGDFFSEPTDYSRPSEAELGELDDIASWFADFGMGGFGALVSEDDGPSPEPADRPRSISSYKNKTAANGRIPAAAGAGKRRSSRVTSASSSSAGQQRRSHAALNAPIPVIVETSSPTTPRAAPRMQQQQLTPKDMGFQPLMAEAQPKRFLFAGAIANRGGGGRTLNHIGLAIDSTRRPSVDSVQSLPQSPMLDLVVSRDVEGNEYVVPMGFNLGHDLGDFLKWEAENVFAIGYGESD